MGLPAESRDSRGQRAGIPKAPGRGGGSAQDLRQMASASAYILSSLKEKYPNMKIQ